MKLGTIVAKNIKALRLENGLSQKDLADKTGLTIRYISRLENTSPNITLEVIEKLARGLSVPPATILNTGTNFFWYWHFKGSFRSNNSDASRNSE